MAMTLGPKKVQHDEGKVGLGCLLLKSISASGFLPAFCSVSPDVITPGAHSAHSLCSDNLDRKCWAQANPKKKSIPKEGLARLCASIYLNQIKEQGACPTSQGNAAVNRIDKCLSQSATSLRASGSLGSILHLQSLRPR